MREETKIKLKGILSNFVRSIIEVPYSIEELKKAYPFHALIFPGEALKAFKRQRSVVTKMGQKLIPQIAEIIAKDKYVDVHRDYEIVGSIDVAKINAIDRIVNELRMGKRRPNHEMEMKEVRDARSEKTREVRLIADLYVGDFAPGPLFLEIKSPRPNLDVCAETKRKILLFKVLYEGRNPQGYMALYYNPYYPKEYAHPFTRRIMDLTNEVLIGQAMWDKLGGKNAYEELLQIIGEVSLELSRT